MLKREDHDSRLDTLLYVKPRWYKKWVQRKRDKPNFDAFAEPERHVCDRFATLETEGHESAQVYFDGLRTSWKKDYIVWCFPPVPLLGKAYKKWCSSQSPLAYFCVPVMENDHVEQIKESPYRSRQPKKVFAEVGNIPEGATWKYEVITLVRRWGETSL